ncbi:Pr6Pr family membrane protein [Prauserella cavernicola]|uniref:Pr6Pr family membrane protein n=1 Tax=Prauserella cavernicola TaxID=2800127 RepID=A0A934QT10_9PSEU|nr:Pr6Pr family membrane protein [Prauserella cavernicola]MBK1785790.1 Pr6Pr family membrane protein [Prauserella cavernicola]
MAPRLLRRPHLLTLLRLAGFGLVVSAEVSLIVHLGARFDPVTHFGYFTVLSNVFAALVLLVGAFVPVPGPIRGAAVLYMVVTGIVYAVLLRGVDVGTPLYANQILHVVIPILVAVDWLADPPRARIALRTALWWLVFPLAYLAVTLVRGPILNWYPYPFLDPGQRGYGGVALMSLFVAVIFLVLTWLITTVGNAKRGQSGAAVEA